MRPRTQNRWFTMFVAIGWLFVCNVAVAETLFVALHNVVVRYSYLESTQDPQTERHVGHSLPHEHEGAPDHKPHGLSHSENLIRSNPVSVQPIKIVILTPFSKTFELSEVLELGGSSHPTSFWDASSPKNFELVGSVLSRAPPFFL